MLDTRDARRILRNIDRLPPRVVARDRAGQRYHSVLRLDVSGGVFSDGT